MRGAWAAVPIWLAAIVTSSAVRLPRTGQAPAPASNAGATYVGSASCATCHASIYDRWKRTRMANIVRDPKEHPDASFRICRSPAGSQNGPHTSTIAAHTHHHEGSPGSECVNCHMPLIEQTIAPEFSPWRVAR